MSASSQPGKLLGIRETEMDKLVTGLKEARVKPVTTFPAQCESSYDGDVYELPWEPIHGSPTVLSIVTILLESPHVARKHMNIQCAK